MNILIVEDGEDLYQPLGVVSNIGEAREFALAYLRSASPENPNTPVPPMFFRMWMRNQSGAYTISVPVEVE